MPLPDVVEVSVIIPVHGDRGGLAKTLECLREQRVDASFEVIVVDNGDNESIGAVVASHPRARLVEERTPGSYAARNAGVRAARGSVLAFTDADCLPGPEWLSEGRRSLESREGAFVGGRVKLVSPRPGRPNLAELWQIGGDLRQDVYVRERGWAVTANLMVRTADFRRVGPFNAGLRSGGDREWGERATSAGLTAVYAEEAVVVHHTRTSLREVQRKIRRVTRGAVTRQALDGTPVRQRAWVLDLRPGVRSAWRQSFRAAPESLSRVRFMLIALWIQYYRLGCEAAWRLRRRADHRGRGEQTT